MTAEELLLEAYNIALQSLDSSNQNGAVIVAESGEIRRGVNNFPDGVEFSEERSEHRPDKYWYFEHSERDAIYQCAFDGVATQNAIMYCPWSSCCDCARGIIESGIRKVVMHSERMQMTPGRWIEDVNTALSMMQEGGVELEYFEGPIHDSPEILVNGELWNPGNPNVVTGNGNWFVGMGR